MSRPCAVVVSAQISRSDLKPAPFLAMASSRFRRSRVDLAKRFQPSHDKNIALERQVQVRLWEHRIRNSEAAFLGDVGSDEASSRARLKARLGHAADPGARRKMLARIRPITAHTDNL